MRIEFIRLVNFVNIYSAFKSKEIYINFNDCKNKIILLTGPNGSGKTSILSCLHPFATNGNLDVRSSEPIVRIGKEGLKEIIITNGDDTYHIKHHFTPNKETHSVKSYIEKNGEQLNSNGNVSSFKDIIKEELDIEIDYLKLIRLGSNVTNFIDLKTTERKAYMGKFLEEVDLFLSYYKKITLKMREMKSIISHLVFKKDKLHISDIDYINERINTLSSDIKNINNDIEKYKNEINILEYEINKYEPLAELEQMRIYYKDKLNDILKLINKKNEEGITSIEDCENKINELNTFIVENSLLVESLKEKRDISINKLESFLYEKSDIEKELSKITEFTDIKDTENMIKELKETIEKRSKNSNLASYDYKYTKKELEEFIVTLDLLNDNVQTLYSFGKLPISRALEYILDNKDIDNYIKQNEEKTKKNQLRDSSEIVYNAFEKKYKNKNLVECNHMYSIGNMFYNFVFDIVTTDPDRVVEDEAFVMYVKLAYSNIQKIVKVLSDYVDLVNKFPKELKDHFHIQSILNRIQNTDIFYKKNIIYNELSIVTEYEINENDIKTYEYLKEKLVLLKKTVGQSEYLEKKREQLFSDIENTHKEITELQNQYNGKLLELEKKKNDLDIYNKLKISIEEKDNISNNYNIYTSSIKNILEFKSKKEYIVKKLNESILLYNKEFDELTDLKTRLEYYNEYEKELKSYNKEYDELEYIKKALSSKEGIPLLFIDIYFKDILDVSNNLLDIVYNGNLFLEEFNITADEFSIPYNKTNISGIKDVCYASQGERSFISLALSFALIYKSITKYNIMLLDEIDSTLDTVNRAMFIKLLEEQQEMIQSEQIFLITHNNMFEMYPVDIIDMKNEEDKEKQMVNYVKINIK